MSFFPHQINALNTLNSRYIAHMRSAAKQAYYALHASVSHPLLYTNPWWLDATCGADGWDVVLKIEQGVPVAGLAFQNTSIRGLSAVVTPPLTQWVAPVSTGELKQGLLMPLMKELPKASILDLTLQPLSEIHLPANVFPVDLKYSYILPYVSDSNQIRQGYNEGLRRNIRQSENLYAVETSNDINTFLQLCASSFAQQKLKPPAWHHTVIPRAYQQLLEKGSGKLMFASFEEKVIAGILIGWDYHTTYYLAGGRATGEQAASAHALLLDQAIHASQLRQTQFDFEGSMHSGIANFFQSFGATPTPYWHIRKFSGLGKLWSAFH